MLWGTKAASSTHLAAAVCITTLARTTIHVEPHSQRRRFLYKSHATLRVERQRYRYGVGGYAFIHFQEVILILSQGINHVSQHLSYPAIFSRLNRDALASINFARFHWWKDQCLRHRECGMPFHASKEFHRSDICASPTEKTNIIHHV